MIEKQITRLIGSLRGNLTDAEEVMRIAGRIRAALPKRPLPSVAVDVAKRIRTAMGKSKSKPITQKQRDAAVIAATGFSCTPAESITRTVFTAAKNEPDRYGDLASDLDMGASPYTIYLEYRRRKAVACDWRTLRVSAVSPEAQKALERCKQMRAEMRRPHNEMNEYALVAACRDLCDAVETWLIPKEKQNGRDQTGEDC